MANRVNSVEFIRWFFKYHVKEYNLDFTERQYRIFRVINRDHDITVFYTYLVRNEPVMMTVRIPYGEMDTHHLIAILLQMQELTLANQFYAENRVQNVLDIYLKKGFLTDREY